MGPTEEYAVFSCLCWLFPGCLLRLCLVFHSVDVSIFSSTIIKDNPLHSQPKKVFFYWFFMGSQQGRHHSLVPLLLTDSNLFRALGILFF